MGRSLATLRTAAQQRANQENKTLVSTSEWNEYIAEAISELYDLIVSAHPHYYVSSTTFTLTGSNTFDLKTLTPTFYKLRGLDYNITASYPRTVHPLNFAERNRYTNQTFSGTYVLWYTPAAPALAGDGDTLDMILDNWAEFIIVTAAIAGAMKEDGDLSGLGAVKAGIISRINAAASNRDGEAGQAADLMFGGRPGDSGRRYMLEGSNLTIVGTDAWDYV